MRTRSGSHQRAAHVVVLEVVLVTAGLVGLAACGSGPQAPHTTPTTAAPSSSTTPQPTQVTPQPTKTIEQPTPTTQQPTTPSGQQTLSVYFYSTLSKDHLAPTARPLGSVTVLADSLRALLAGPNPAEQKLGLSTRLPDGFDIHQVDLRNGIASVELASAPATENNLSDAALAQVVFTATQFPTVRAVEVEVDGEHAVAPDRSSAAGGEFLTRADFEEWSPAVLIESPVIGSAIRSPVRIYGTANTYEAVFQLEITDWDGRIVATHTVMATSGTGTRGTFDVTVPYTTTRSGPGEIITSFQSPKDGSRIVVTETPVTVHDG